MLIWSSLVALLIGLALVLWRLSITDHANPGSQKRFDQALDKGDEDWLSHRRLRTSPRLSTKAREAMERMPGTDMAEVQTLMGQAGLNSPQARAMVYASLWVTPLVAVVLGTAYGLSGRAPLLMAMVLSLGCGFIAPRKLLRHLAARRQRAIREELPIMLNLLRLMFDAGLSLEHSLKAISEQARPIAPHLADEFAAVLLRIYHGQERGDALDDMSRRLDVPELTETTAILKQATRHGGSIRDSLLRYLRLMEERHLTELREKVGKLSAKMTVVMVVFMFPALMIFLAGPGMLALTKALTRTL